MDFTKNGFRLEIASVQSGGYADRIGLMRGDIIDSIDGVFQRDVKSTMGQLTTKSTPFKLTVVRPDLFARNKKKKKTTLDVLMERYPRLEKKKLLTLLQKKMRKSIARCNLAGKFSCTNTQSFSYLKTFHHFIRF